MAWTDDEVRILRYMTLLGGFSASDIASKLHNKTRNAVIGKTRRLGLHLGNGRGQRSTARPLPKASPQPVSPPRSLQMWKPRLRLQAKPPLPRSDKERVMFEGSGGCRWPVGTDMYAADYFCGAEREFSYPYCLRHCRIAYQNFGRSQELPRSSAA